MAGLEVLRGHGSPLLHWKLHVLVKESKSGEEGRLMVFAVNNSVLRAICSISGCRKQGHVVDLWLF